MKISIFLILTVINLSNQKNINELNCHITYLAALNDNVTLASGLFDDKIKIWKETSNQLIRTLKNHNQSTKLIL